ncbi:hypothetical protein COLO4_34268 [Corchorus olitorius]|uniref:Uncharacterized protein n=1 Tax=Corchorus olitorius TaxID=93759 RepID=A0A1R3GMI4_9ROSI|nr:hypothetical protein COLO4_34268 [Corchorus olitorius]
MEENLFLFKFQSEGDRDRVIDGCPWNFDNSLLLFAGYNGGLRPNQYVFTKGPFWIRIYDLPMGMPSAAMARTIGARLGDLIDVDDTLDKGGWSIFLRVRVSIDITKPLRRTVAIKEIAKLLMLAVLEKLVLINMDHGYERSDGSGGGGKVRNRALFINSSSEKAAGRKLGQAPVGTKLLTQGAINSRSRVPRAAVITKLVGDNLAGMLDRERERFGEKLTMSENRGYQEKQFQRS